MDQMSLKFKSYARDAGNASIINNNIERIMLRIIFWSFGLLALLYILILGNMVRNIIQRRSLEVSLRTLGSEVGDLELSYLSMSNNVDLTLSYSLGFKDAKATFATRKTLGLRPIPLGSIKTLKNDI